MLFLPIVERELRLATQRRRMYWARSCAATVAVVIGAWMVANVETWQAGASVGRGLFEVLSTLAFGLCLVAGVFTTSICLVEEKQGGTLGLLFLTDLRGYDVVLGKLAAVSLNTVQMLMGIFPVLAIPLILGGVSSGEFWRMTLVLLNTLLFSLTAGMFISSLSRHLGKAMSGTVLLVGLTTAGLAALDQILFEELKFFGAEYFLLPGPFQSFALVADAKFNLPLNSFWEATAFTAWLTLGFLTFASLILPRTCAERPRTRKVDNWRERFARWATGDAADWRRARAHILRNNPVFWLASRRRWKWFYVWASLGLALGLWLVALRYYGFVNGAYRFSIFVCLTIVLHAILKIWIASEATSRFVEARRNGELELLLVTPLSVRKICRGHLMAIWRQFRGPIVLVLLIDVGLMLFGERFVEKAYGSDLMLWLFIWAMLIMLLLDARTLAWVGLWEGLQAKNSLVALKITLVRILVVPWGIFLATLMISPTFYLYGALMESEPGWFLGAVIWWWIIGFMVNTVFQLRAQRDLENQFREAAEQRVGGHKLSRTGRSRMHAGFLPVKALNR